MELAASKHLPASQGVSGVGSRWISANAGSGKTHALVSRVTTLLLLGVPPERICCITYTRAAAAEMRARVTANLRGLLLASDGECRERCASLLGRAPTAEEFARARQLFNRLLDSPTGGLELTTIHGFCQRLLRAFPLEAKIAPYFTVLEDTEINLLMHRASQQLFDADEDDDVVHALALMAERMAEEGFHARIKAILNRRAYWQHVWRGQTRASLKERLYALHRVAPETTDAALIEAFSAFPNATDAAIIRSELPRLAAHKNQREKKVAAALERWLLADTNTRRARYNDAVELWLTQKYTLRSPLLNEKDFPHGTPFRDAIERWAVAARSFIEQRAALACAEESYAVALVAQAVLAHYDQLKQQRSALDYEDLIIHTVRLLMLSDMTAWVMSKLDHRIDHLLIDEAQDTSCGQWEIVKALIGELIASSDGVGAAGIPRTLFVVGDEKQSIFSFQGADPQLFAANQSFFASLLSHSTAPLQAETLNMSRRSAPAILTLVDAVATQPAVAQSLMASGMPEAHRLHRKDTVGEVALYPLLAPEEKIKPEPFTIPTEYQMHRGAVHRVAEAIAQKVSAWLRDGRILVNEGRPIKPGDILILVRHRQRMAGSLIRALEREGVPVAGLDRLVLSDHLAVNDLMQLMRWVGYTRDDLALAQVLRSPLIGISEEALLTLAHGRGEQSLWESVCDNAAPGTISHLQDWLEHKDDVPYGFLTHVLEVSDARRRFATRFGDEVHEVLDELKAQAAQLPVTPTLANFVSFVLASERIIKREQEAGDKLRIMTVHGAKGLEAPVVILADTVTVPDLKHETTFSADDETAQSFPLVPLSAIAKEAPLLQTARESRRAALRAEYQRLLYVAITRARDELHVFGAGKEAAEYSWYETIAASLKSLAAITQEDGSIVLRDAPVPTLIKGTPCTPVRIALPAWATAAPRAIARVEALTPSGLAPATLAPFSRYVPGQTKERGVRIHRVLEFLRGDTSRQELASLVAIVAADWDEKTQHAVTEEIWTLYQREQWLWEAQAHAEVSISGTIEVHGIQKPVNGQIDRLVRTNNGLVILDYKTSRAVPASAAEVPLAYLLQLKTYAALLARMEPGTPIHSGILWTSGPVWMDVTEAVEHVSWLENNSFY